MSGLKIAGVILVGGGLVLHAYVARKAPRFRGYIIAGAVLEAIGVSILAAVRQ